MLNVYYNLKISNRYIVMTVIPLILCVFSIFILYIEMRSVKFALKGLLRFKSLLCLFITAYNLGNFTWLTTLAVSLHYSVLPSALTVYSFFFEDNLRFICLFLVSYFYCIQASGLLTKARLWLMVLRIVLYGGVACIIVMFITLLVKQSTQDMDSSSLCKDYTFIADRVIEYVL